MTFLLDTDIASYIMKRSDREVLERLQRVRVGDVAISSVTKSELEYRRRDLTAASAGSRGAR